MGIELLNYLDQPVAMRSLAAFALCSVLGLMFGNRVILWLRLRFREPIKSISPTVVRLHQFKAQTPTMGGLFIVIGIMIGSLVFGDLRDIRVWIALGTLVSFAMLGAIDDLIKLRTDRRGLSVTTKLISQFAIAIVIALSLATTSQDTGLLGIAKNIVILVAAANAVNLTDGLDGLASGCGLVASSAIALMLLFTNASDLAVVSAALAGALAAFLWYNKFPAKVFMGDTGSQAIGAQLGCFAIIADGNWSFFVVCGIFFIEIASVAMQMASYKLRGKRLFLCAPLHHHFQFAGWAEPSIVRLFCLAALVFAIAGIYLMTATSPMSVAAEFAVPERNLSVASRVKPEAQRGKLLSTTPDIAVVREEGNLR